MDLTPYVDRLRRELAVAAAAGGDNARELAERLTAPLESAARLALLEALSAAADEITRDLAPGSVDVRLRGRDPDFIVTSPPAERPADDDIDSAPLGPPGPGEQGGPAAAPPPDAEEGRTSRITLRVPDHLKPRIDEAAEREGLSVNAWLVRAITAALESGDGQRSARRSGWRATAQVGRHYTGWVR